MHFGKLKRSAFFSILALAGATSLSTKALAQSPGPLTSYNAAITESSVSGISSGAFMAVQFGTAWSSVIKGVGVVAGGPFWCAQAQASDIINGYTLPILTATGPCMKGPPPDLQIFIDKANAMAQSGVIDPTAGLGHQKIYLFHGYNDAVVAKPVTDAAADFYRHYLGDAAAHNLYYQTAVGAGHSYVVLQEPNVQGLNNCPVNQSPYINQCSYDQAGIVLQHIYGALNPRNPGQLAGTMKSFAQAPYTAPDLPSILSMGDTGYVYVPKDCETGQSACRVHIALHGCKQDAGDIGTTFIDDTGYNAWADTNRIIILYPQTVAQPLPGFPSLNPEACWDWWSYVTHNENYVAKPGLQIKSIKAMLDALTGGQPAPQDPPAPGTAPTALIITDTSDSGAALAWKPVAGADSYNVMRAEADGAFAPVGSIVGPSYGDSGLKA